MKIPQVGVVAVVVGAVGAAPTTTLSAAQDVGMSTMDVYPPSGSKFSPDKCLVLLYISSLGIEMLTLIFHSRG